MTAKKNKLTIKQESFCKVYIETGNASEAYRRSYNAENMKAESIVVNASKLIRNTNVALRLEELHKAHQKRHEVTVDSLTAELDEARKGALDTGQNSAAIQAIMGKAKLHGLLSDNVNIKNDYKGDPAGISDAELARTITASGGTNTSATQGSARKPH